MVCQTQSSKQCGAILQEELLTNDHNENIIKNWPKFHTHPLIVFMQGRICKLWVGHRGASNIARRTDPKFETLLFYNLNLILINENARTKILVCETKRCKQWCDTARGPNCKEAAEFDQFSCKDEDNGVPDTEEQAVWYNIAKRTIFQ